MVHRPEDRLADFRRLVRGILPVDLCMATTDAQIDAALESVLVGVQLARLNPDRLGPLADVVAVRLRRQHR